MLKLTTDKHEASLQQLSFLFNAVWALTSGGFCIVSDTLACFI